MVPPPTAANPYIKDAGNSSVAGFSETGEKRLGSNISIEITPVLKRCAADQIIPPPNIIREFPNK